MNESQFLAAQSLIHESPWIFNPVTEEKEREAQSPWHESQWISSFTYKRRIEILKQMKERELTPEPIFSSFSRSVNEQPDWRSLQSLFERKEIVKPEESVKTKEEWSLTPTPIWFILSRDKAMIITWTFTVELLINETALLNLHLLFLLRLSFLSQGWFAPVISWKKKTILSLFHIGWMIRTCRWTDMTFTSVLVHLQLVFLNSVNSWLNYFPSGTLSQGK